MKTRFTLLALILLFIQQCIYAQSGLQLLKVTSMPVPANAAITINGTGFSDDLNHISVRIGTGNLCKAIKLTVAGDGTQNLLVQLGSQAAYDYMYITQSGLVSMSPNRVNVVSGCNQTTNISSASFSAPVVIPSAITDTIVTVATGDMDNDGQMDVVSAKGKEGKIAIIAFSNIVINYATGKEDSFPTAGTVTSIQLADMNSDGKLDILTTETISHADTTIDDTTMANIYPYNPSTSGFGPEPVLVVKVRTKSNQANKHYIPRDWVFSRDFDQDGWSDIVFVSSVNGIPLYPEELDTLVNDDPLNQQGEVIVCKNEWPEFTVQSADFLTHASDSLIEPGDTSMAIEDVEIAVGDINGDGLPDVVCKNAIHTKGTGGTRTAAVAQVAYTTPCNGGPSCFDLNFVIKARHDIAMNAIRNLKGREMAVGDIDGDGHDDIILCLYDSAVIFSGAMLDCNCQEGATTADLNAFLGHGGGAQACAIADINSDGKLDIAFYGFDTIMGSGDVTAFQNNSISGRIELFPKEVSAGSESDLTDFIATDQNADGKPDLIFAKGATISMAKNIQTCSDVFQPICNNLCYVAGNNIVTNGNFNSKTANQVYTPSNSFNAAAFADLTAAGTYVIGTNAGAQMANWCGTDHTSGAGNMVMANGFKTSKTSAWGQVVPVLANTNYTFSAYINNLTCPSKNFTDPKIELRVNGTVTGITYTIKEKPDGWVFVSGNWFSGATPGTATIEIVDTAAGNNGNDFAIDDIQFYGCLPNIIVDAGPDVSTCKGSSIQLNAKLKLGGKDGIDVLHPGTISWSPATGLSATDIPNPVATPLNTTTYTVTYTAANGMCTKLDQVTVTVNENPAAIITASGAVNNICPGKTVTLTAAAATTYLWSTGATTQSIVVSTAGSYTVMVSNSSGCKATSAATVVTYKSCDKPKSLATASITATSARVSWAAVTCAVQYKYEWRKKGTAIWTTAQTNTISRTITGLASGTTYQWRVNTTCKISPDTITSPGYATGPEFTTVAGAISANVGGINEIQKGYSLQANLYPNPTNNIAFISISKAQGKVQVILSDVSGKQLWQSGKTSSTNISIPIQNLAQGTYIVMVKDDKERVVVKMVKE